MDCFDCADFQSSVPQLLFRTACLIPPWQYFIGFLLFVLALLYNFLELHIIQDVLCGMGGDPVSLTFDSSSDMSNALISRCKILSGRYRPTVWLPSPHLQTAFLQFFGNAPTTEYTRQIFHVPDGGTIALDWFTPSELAGRAAAFSFTVPKDDPTPIVVVVPGLTSDSSSAYIRHLVSEIANRGWKAVICNHRGLGGISITSDCFYNAGWTEDLRRIINYLHEEHPNAPLFAIGTSIGANILVKYLGEEQDGTSIAGAASICSPWDLVVCDRFISRKLVQRMYDRVLTIGLLGYAYLHQPVLSRLADWECVKKSRTVRDFDNHVTCLVGKFETVDTYYRHCSSVPFLGNVSVPLLCLSALDDPVCTKEAIPWDECRANKNIILATTTHGGHLAYFDGFGAKRIWWVGAVAEYISVLHESPYMHKQDKTRVSGPNALAESSIDKGPFLNFVEDGILTAVGEGTISQIKEESSEPEHIAAMQAPVRNSQDLSTVEDNDSESKVVLSVNGSSLPLGNEVVLPRKFSELSVPIMQSVNKLSRRYNVSLWLLAYIAIATSWPLVGPALLIFAKRKLKTAFPAFFSR